MRAMLVVAVSACAVLATGLELAYACSPFPAAKPFAIPRPNAAAVSTATSVYIVSFHRPAWVEVTAGGASVKTDGLQEMGDVYLPGARGKLWKIMGLDPSSSPGQGILQPSTEYVVSMEDAGGRVELTRFTTASGYDKDKSGIPPKLRSVKLWRVRYPAEKVGGGECISAEYHGAILLDYDPAEIPDTPEDSTVYTITLHPKTGGASHTRHFFGSDLYKGYEPTPPDYSTEFPPWPIDLDPTREYCVYITVAGYGDIAGLGYGSEPVCAPVTPISLTTDGGATTDAGPAVGAGGDDAGCSIAPSTADDGPVATLLVLLAALLGFRRR